MTEELPVSEARTQLSELVNRVRFGGERIILTRHGKGVAALVPLETLSAEVRGAATDRGHRAQIIDLDSRGTVSPSEVAAHTEPWT